MSAPVLVTVYVLVDVSMVLPVDLGVDVLNEAAIDDPTDDISGDFEGGDWVDV